MGCGSSKDGASRGMPVALPNADPLKAQRPADLEKMRGEYAWTFAGSLTPFVKEIPKREETRPAAKHTRGLYTDVIGTVASLGFNKALDLAHDVFTDDGPFNDWEDLFPMCKVPTVATRWRTDEEFARQRLNGTMGTLIRRIRALPANFPVAEELVAATLATGADGATLAQLLSQGRVYLCDYKKLDGLPSPADRCACAPIVLLFVDKRGTLMPLAVQLTQQPGPESPIFVPTDPPGLWLAVKIHCQVADTAISEMAVHLAQTHLLPEAAYVSMMRQLHPRHPLHQFLEPHFFYTMIINDGGRSNLLLEGRSIPRLYALGYEGVWALLEREMTTCRWDLEFNIPRQIADRDVGELKNYFYRDDALRLWGVLSTYITALVNEFYASDEALAADVEVQAWFVEMTGSVAEKKGCGLLGLPVGPDGRIKTRADLATFLTELLATITVAHAAVNDPQADLMMFVPNKPQTFRLPLPKTKDDIPLTTIAKALPNFANSAEQITLMHVLAKTTHDPIGSYEEGFLAGRPGAQPIIKKFCEELRQVSKEIEARDAKLEVPYPYLNPKTIAQSVAI